MEEEGQKQEDMETKKNEELEQEKAEWKIRIGNMRMKKK